MTRGPARPDGATAPADPAPAGPDSTDSTDAVLTGLRRHAQHLVAELDGPVRRVRLCSGETVLEVEWHGSVALPPAARSTVDEPSAAPRPAPPPHAGEPDADPHTMVRAPIVGTFYRAPEPGAPPYVAVGDLVRPGQVVGIVEAMKLMNEVTADRGGRVAAVLAEDGQPVEYDQPLLALDPA